jgi:NADH-quinone oxidoreductase subunit C
MTNTAIIQSLQGLHDAASENLGMLVLGVSAANLPAAVQRLRGGFGFELLLDVTAIDHSTRSPRFDVVYHFYSRAHNTRVRLKVPASAENPTVPSLTAWYGSARFLERETHDMYGIHFEGNGDLRPILLYEGFVGHPLRKDYAMEAEQPIVPYRQVTP